MSSQAYQQLRCIKVNRHVRLVYMPIFAGLPFSRSAGPRRNRRESAGLACGIRAKFTPYHGVNYIPIEIPQYQIESLTRMGVSVYTVHYFIWLSLEIRTHLVIYWLWVLVSFMEN